MSTRVNQNMRNECQGALEILEKLNLPNTTELQSKLKFCIGSFDFDKNPVGLHEYAVVALQALKDIKKTSPRKVTKKVVDGLEASIKKYESSRG
jgi:hypothetical protein